MQKQYVKYNHVHGAKQQLLGNPAQQVPPAWRTNAPSPALNGSVKGKEVQGSKIFISGLPFDVGEKEIEVQNFSTSELWIFL
jgi:THO complex subunit 4